MTGEKPSISESKTGPKTGNTPLGMRNYSALDKITADMVQLARLMTKEDYDRLAAII